MNILGSCTYFTVNLLKLSSKLKEAISRNYDIEDNTSTLIMSEESINEFNVPSEAIDYSTGEFDEEELRDLLVDMIGNHSDYLVLASGCRWNGSSGYMFCDDIVDTVKRNYSISLRLVEEFKNGIECMESSHDVPTGSSTYIIGITSEERDHLEDVDFDEIEQFVHRRMS